MKKLVFMAMMAGAASLFASQNDPTIPVQVEAGRTYALLCRGGLVRNYTATDTMLVNFQGDAQLSIDPSDYQVVLVGESSAGGLGDGVSAIDETAFADYVCVYSDGKAVGAGERLLLVKCADGSAFKGVDGVCYEIDRTANQIKDVFARTDSNGRFSSVDFANIPADGQYELVLLDTRLPDGTLSADDSVAFEGVVRPTFVRAWGVMTFDAEGKVSGISWTPSELGENAVLKQFDFDPRPFLATGYAAVLDENGDQVAMLGALAAVRGLAVKTSWMVFPYPKAYVKVIDNPTLTNGDNYADLRTGVQIPKEFQLEATYQFDAFTNENERSVVLNALQGKEVTKGSFNLAATLAEIGGGNLDPTSLTADQGVFLDWYLRNSPFFAWNCDFVVSFNADIRKDTFILAGFYDYLSAWSQYRSKFTMIGDMQLPWIGSSSTNDMAAGETFRLLQSYKGDTITVNYNEICTKVQTFKCGVYNGEPENYGKTITVKLNLYPNYGRDNESGDVINVGTYEYTFKGPLTVTFDHGPTAPEDEVVPAPFATNYDGKVAIKLPVPTYNTSIHSNLTFVGWSNSVELVNLVYVPTNTWGELKLWSDWKKAQTVVINPDTNKTENVASIKVADEWLEGNNLKDATPKQVAETLQKPAADGGKIPLWQTYVLGLNPSGTVEVVATEKMSEDKALVVSTVQAPPPDSGFKVTYSLDKIDKTTEKPIDDAHKGKEQDTKDIAIDLEPQDGETPTGYYKMNVFITPVKDDVEVKDEQVQVKSEVTVGVLTVKTEEPVVPVAIPWTSLAETPDENAEIPADEIVQPQGLTDGDELFVYDREGEVYTTLTLKGGKWVADGQTVPVDESGTAEEATQAGVVPTVKRGYGMWLKRQDPSKSFHLFGQYNKTAEKTKIVPPADGQKKAEYNLIAPTGIEDTDLNSVPSLGAGADPQDKLMIVENGVPTYYNFNSDTKKWGYNKQEIVTRTVGGRTVTGVRTKRVEESVNVPAGTGLWYISRGGEPEIDWNAKQGE